jgi:ParB family protein of integrating conjugative element (PFGI_1 class)
MASSKNRPTSDELKGLLLEGNFGGSADEPLPLTDPISTTQMVLTLHDIKPYDKNPRREKNPAYEDIKASIRSKKQLNNNFNVTRRPGDDLFMVESGGNTRLAILKELYLETMDEAFNTVHCLFIPWKSETSVLTAHLIENEMRGDMMLIDKAYAVQELKRELEAEKGGKLSDIAFTRLASDNGYKISPKHLRRFNYAIELDQIIPQVLRSGIGGHKIDHIKKVEKAYRQYCSDKTDQFNVAFMAVMAESDDDELWDFDQTRQELDDSLAELTAVRANLLRLEVDAILFNTRLDRSDEDETPAEDKEPSKDQVEPVKTPISQSESSVAAQSQEIDPGINEIGSSDISESEGDMIQFEDEVTGSAAPLNEDESDQPGQKKPTVKLKLLHQKGCDLACRIARGAGIEEAVMPAKCGMGFFMEALPQQFQNATSYYNWWLLLGISEQNVKDESHYPMWAFTDLYNRFGEDQRNQDDSLVNWIGSDPGVMNLMFELLHNREHISDPLFTDCFRLMENCRTIRRNFTDNEIWTEER